MLNMIEGQSLFESAMVLAGSDHQVNILRQLSRWVKAGKLLQLRRGLYAIAPPYASHKPHPFTVAGRLIWPSYVSLQSALAWHGLIPEDVPVCTSITTRRPGAHRTPLGVFQFRHVKTEFFWGYKETWFDHGQTAFVARPEKALLDLCYLTSGADSPEYIRTLRIDPECTVDLSQLQNDAQRSGSAKLQRFADLIAAWLNEERAGGRQP
ncbi:hypothetical protein ACFL3H_06215 [Gemmatimonadota bacterium]